MYIGLGTSVLTWDTDRQGAYTGAGGFCSVCYVLQNPRLLLVHKCKLLKSSKPLLTFQQVMFVTKRVLLIF